MRCYDSLSSSDIISLISHSASADSMRLFPFSVAPTGIHAICPCCVVDRRAETKDLQLLQSISLWSSFFRKERAKEHSLTFERVRKPLVEDGFRIRGLEEKSRRSRYANIDTPIFRELGFRGHKFDRSVFLLLGAYKSERRLRIGIPNPDLLESYPLLQRVASSWIFRVSEVPPIDFPDMLPISCIGDIRFSNQIQSRNVYSWGMQLSVDPFFDALLRRADKKLFKTQSLILPV